MENQPTNLRNAAEVPEQRAPTRLVFPKLRERMVALFETQDQRERSRESWRPLEHHNEVVVEQPAPTALLKDMTAALNAKEQAAKERETPKVREGAEEEGSDDRESRAQWSEADMDRVELGLMTSAYFRFPRLSALANSRVPSTVWSWLKTVTRFLLSNVKWLVRGVSKLAPISQSTIVYREARLALRESLRLTQLFVAVVLKVIAMVLRAIRMTACYGSYFLLSALKE